MAENKQSLDELLNFNRKTEDTERFLRRIAALALEKAEIMKLDEKQMKKYKIPKNDDAKDLAKDWTDKLYNVAAAQIDGKKTSIKNEDLKEFEDTMKQWGNDLGEKVVKETVQNLNKLSDKEKENKQKIENCLVKTLKGILDSWNTKSLKNKIYSWGTNYSQRIQKLSQSINLLDIVKKGEEKKT